MNNNQKIKIKEIKNKILYLLSEDKKNINIKILNFLIKENILNDNYFYILLKENKIKDTKESIGYINYLITTLKIEGDNKIINKIHEFIMTLF